MYQFLETIQLKDNGVPVLSHKKIEFITTRCLEIYNNSLLTSPSEVNIHDFIIYLTKTDGLKYETRTLGKILDNAILGVTDLKENAIYIDPLTELNPHRLRFTQAHEVGHWILHRHKPVEDYNVTDRTHIFKDTEDSLNMQKRLVTPTDWIEWQANAFASALLIPISTFGDAVQNGIKELSIHTQTDMYDSIEVSPKDYSRLILYLQQLYNVSQTTISYRLKQLESIKPSLI